MAKAGLVLERHLTIGAQATEVRVLVRDAGSEDRGSVTIPLRSLLEEPDSSVGRTKPDPL